jgi:uncharacterized protein (TIGR03435 family)
MSSQKTKYPMTSTYSVLNLNFSRKLLPFAAILMAMPAFCQGTTNGKASFDVASVRQNKSKGGASANIDLTSADGPIATGGLYQARNIALIQYIAFAYKLKQIQLQSAVTQAPWTAEDRFDIEARAEGNPTKEQYRMMMRSLLADRFKLVVHFDTRQVPLYALVLAKPGKLGPNLRLHQADDPVCANPPDFPASGLVTEVDAAGFPKMCGGPFGMKPSQLGQIRNGGRNVAMERFATVIPGVAEVDRPMVDETGLKDTVDYTLEWKQIAASAKANANPEPDESILTFDVALKQQLGIKMVAKKGPMEFFVVDHIEHPSEN